MGLYADHAGRRAALSASVALMCGGALIIAVTPSFQRIGLWAPAILLLARVLQGLSVGGEYGASATYMSEMAGKSRRGFWSSFHYVTLIAGQLIAEHGGTAAYRQARLNARVHRERGTAEDLRLMRLWSRVAVKVARRASREIGADAATRLTQTRPSV